MNLAALVNEHSSSEPARCSTGGDGIHGERCAASAAVASALSRMGVSAGDRVAIAWPNSADFVYAYLGVLSAGAVAVPLNPNSPTSELCAELSTVEAPVLLAGGQAALAAAELAASHGSPLGLKIVVPSETAGSADEVQSGLAGSVVGSWYETIDPVTELDRLDVAERAADDLAALMFTSGTAGSPHAAKLTHGNLVSNLKQMLAVPDILRREDIALGAVPLFHIFGLNVALGLVLATGAGIVLEERFDPSRSLELVSSLGVTVIVGVPPMFAAWAHAAESGPESDPERGRSRLASVRHAVSGAASLSPEVARLFEQRFGIPVWQGYGLTEASPAVATSLGTERNQPGSVGRPLPGVEVRLVDDTGEEALAGDPGEIWVHGPNVFVGYWDDEAATSQVLTADGWLVTGDIGVAGEEGDLFVVDRRKDLVIVSGFNVFPGEVERTIREMPGVAEAAVIGRQDAVTGEAVVAFVVKTPGASLSPADVAAFCASRLAHYKCPAEVRFADELPSGLAGKALRRMLRQEPP